jgi:hypothetical protein
MSDSSRGNSSVPCSRCYSKTADATRWNSRIRSVSCLDGYLRWSGRVHRVALVHGSQRRSRGFKSRHLHHKRAGQRWFPPDRTEACEVLSHELFRLRGSQTTQTLPRQDPDLGRGSEEGGLRRMEEVRGSSPLSSTRTCGLRIHCTVLDSVRTQNVTGNSLPGAVGLIRGLDEGLGLVALAQGSPLLWTGTSSSRPRCGMTRPRRRRLPIACGCGCERPRWPPDKPAARCGSSPCPAGQLTTSSCWCRSW